MSKLSHLCCKRIYIQTLAQAVLTNLVSIMACGNVTGWIQYLFILIPHNCGIERRINIIYYSSLYPISVEYCHSVVANWFY